MQTGTKRPFTQKLAAVRAERWVKPANSQTIKVDYEAFEEIAGVVASKHSNRARLQVAPGRGMEEEGFPGS